MKDSHLDPDGVPFDIIGWTALLSVGSVAAVGGVLALNPAWRIFFFAVIGVIVFGFILRIGHRAIRERFESDELESDAKPLSEPASHKEL